MHSRKDENYFYLNLEKDIKVSKFQDFKQQFDLLIEKMQLVGVSEVMIYDYGLTFQDFVGKNMWYEKMNHTQRLIFDSELQNLLVDMKYDIQHHEIKPTNEILSEEFILDQGFNKAKKVKPKIKVGDRVKYKRNVTAGEIDAYGVVLQIKGNKVLVDKDQGINPRKDWVPLKKLKRF